MGSLLHSESKIHVLSGDFDRAVEIAAEAIATRKGGWGATLICHACAADCSASLTACPRCKATLIVEPKNDLAPPGPVGTNGPSDRKYCPLCHAAYSATRHRCTICGVELVPEELRGKPFSEQAKSDRIEIVWRGGDPVAVSEVVRVLREAGIRHHVESTHDHLVFELAMPRPKYVVRVFQNDMEKAKQLVSTIEDSPLFGVEIASDFPEEGSTSAHAPNRNWSPAMATTEVWTGVDAAFAQVLQDCLKENHIGVRRGGREPGILRLSVMPQDEAAAREIIREVHDGTPPN
jgi:hypothetical protein